MTQTQNQNLPRQFGKYVLVRKIAMGGMAEIFKAKTAGAEGFEKDVVIKRILPSFTEDEAFVKMFIDEASITSKLQHANIVQIFDFDVCEGSYYIAMELIEGVDLKRVIEVGIKSGKPLSVAQTTWTLMEISKGLHYAHVKEHKGQPLNIVHRDISPHNAMVSFNGEVKLMDFGIAKAAERSTKTIAGTVKGKVAYMSPEQARGKPLDGRSDLFALGIMMWEILTGKRLFLGESDFETLTNVLKKEPPPPSTFNPKVPKDLDEIVLKAMRKDRDERYASVEAFARDLTRWYYSNVMDLEAESLKRYMTEIFADDIARNKQLTAEERGEAKPGSAAPAPVVAEQNAERTLAMPADEGMQKALIGEVAAPPKRATTTNMKASATPSQTGMKASPTPSQASMKASPTPSQTGMKAAGAGATPSQTGMKAAGPATGSGVARPGTQTNMKSAPEATKGTGSYANLAPPEGGSKTWLWVLLILLAGGAVAVYFAFFAGSGGEKPPETPPAATGATSPGEGGDSSKKSLGELVLKVEPTSAKLTVDGKEVEGTVSGLEIGKTVKVTAEADGFVRFEGDVTLEGSKTTKEIKLEAASRKLKIVADGDKQAAIKVNGETVGKGEFEYTGKNGVNLVVEIVPSTGGEAIKREVTLDGSEAELKVAVVVATGKLVLSLNPEGASVKADKGTVSVSPDGKQATIEGIALNDSVEVTVEKAGFEPKVQKYLIAEASMTLTVSLAPAGAVPAGKPSDKPAPPVEKTAEKPATPAEKPVVAGKGTVAVVSTPPGAVVTVDGRPVGRAPQSLKLDPGSHTVVMTHNGRKETRVVKVNPGGSIAVSHDFTK